MLLNKSEEAARENASLFEHFHNHPNYTNGLKSRLVCREVSYSNIYGKIANRTKKLLLILLHRTIQNHQCKRNYTRLQIFNKCFLKLKWIDQIIKVAMHAVSSGEGVLYIRAVQSECGTSGHATNHHLRRTCWVAATI